MIGGSTAAEPDDSPPNVNHIDEFDDFEASDPPRTAEDFDDHKLAEWVKSLSDRSAVKWQEEQGFFYLTDEDYKNGMTHTPWPAYERVSNRTDFDCGPYGILRAIVINGAPWCSLQDAGRLAGVPGHWITGWLSEEQLHVRGLPGYLKPDGIRWLQQEDIRDKGIRLEALVPHVIEHRHEDPRVLSMLADAIANIYDKHPPTSGGVTGIPCTDLWRRFDRPHKTGQIYQRIHFDRFGGEFATVQIGTQLWFRLDDFSGFTYFDPAIISQIAGPARLLTIKDSMIFPLFDAGNEKTYVRADVVEKLHAAMPREPFTRDPFVIQIASEHRGLLCSGGYQTTIMATSLHGMLGPHLDFEVWSSEMQQKYCGILRDFNFNRPFDTGDDYPLPLYLARHISAEEGTFAGKVTALLLTDGGYLHGGPIDETADATLIRFQGLVPDRRGQVHIRKIWEFLNLSETFEEWYQAGLDLGWEEPGPTLDYHTASIDGSWAQEIWQALDSDHYCPGSK